MQTIYNAEPSKHDIINASTHKSIESALCVPRYIGIQQAGAIVFRLVLRAISSWGLKDPSARVCNILQHQTPRVCVRSGRTTWSMIPYSCASLVSKYLLRLKSYWICTTTQQAPKLAPTTHIALQNAAKAYQQAVRCQRQSCLTTSESRGRAAIAAFSRATAQFMERQAGTGATGFPLSGRPHRCHELIGAAGFRGIQLKVHTFSMG